MSCNLPDCTVTFALPDCTVAFALPDCVVTFVLPTAVVCFDDATGALVDVEGEFLYDTDDDLMYEA
jgi:hypothetical protein